MRESGTPAAPHAAGQPGGELFRLAVRVRALSPDDAEGLVDIGAAVEEVQQALPEGSPALAPLARALEGLQGVYTHAVPDARAALEAVAEALVEADMALAPAHSSAPSEPCQRSNGGQGTAGSGLADADLVAEFVIEARENIERAEAALLALETTPGDPEALNTVFRAFHTIKGAAGFLGLDPITGLTHAAETLLSQAREGELELVGGYADLALRAADMLSDLIQAVQHAAGAKPLVTPPGYEELLAALVCPQETWSCDDTANARTAVPRLGDLLVANQAADRAAIEAAAAQQSDRPLGEALVKAGVARVTDVAHALRAQQCTKATKANQDTIRIRTDRLDRLVEAVGELVVAHSMVMQDETVASQRNLELSKKAMRVAKIVRELQDLTMAMRMVPLRATMQKMARVAWDVARKHGRELDFVTEGEDTEIDRSIAELLSEPLLHMVRNAVHHGIEPPEERRRAGKPARGQVKLSARRASGSVVLELQDDGRGLDRARIVQRAVARGLIATDHGMTDSQVLGLIFAPGLSTAEHVNEVVGRGVGLDVVQQNVEAMRGRIEVASEPGNGCCFTLRLPLTLAVTDGMLVRVGRQRFVMPMLNIDLTVRLGRTALFTTAQRGEMVLVRGEVLPLLRLHRLFGIPDAVEDPTEGLVVVTEDSCGRYALLVDALVGQQQVVARPLGEGMKGARGVSAGAILSDGQVGLILDPQDIWALAWEMSGVTAQ